MDTKEKMAKQRQFLNARLGLDVGGKLDFDTNSLFTNEDLMTSPEKSYTDARVHSFNIFVFNYKSQYFLPHFSEMLVKSY